MRIGEKGLALIKEFESFVSFPYTCPAGKLTIGYGHVVLQDEEFTKITPEEGEKLLINDCAIAENCINKLVKVELNQNQFDALVSFVFNVGRENFFASTLLKQLNKKDYNEAAEQFTRWM